MNPGSQEHSIWQRCQLYGIWFACFLISIFIFETRVSLLLTGLELIYVNSEFTELASTTQVLDYWHRPSSLVCFSLCILGTAFRVFPCQAKSSTIKLYPWFTYILRLGLISYADWPLACDPPEQLEL